MSAYFSLHNKLVYVEKITHLIQKLDEYKRDKQYGSNCYAGSVNHYCASYWEMDRLISLNNGFYFCSFSLTHFVRRKVKHLHIESKKEIPKKAEKETLSFA